MAHRIVARRSHGRRLVLRRPPEVGDEARGVVDDLKSRRLGCCQQKGRRAAERFNVLLGPAKPRPNIERDRAFTAENKGRVL
jgi:hypothetical protein